MTAVAFGHFGALPARQVAVAGTAVGLGSEYANSIVISNAVAVVVGGDVRYTVAPAGVPTASVGILAPAGGVITITDRASFKSFRAIQVSGAAELTLQPYSG